MWIFEPNRLMALDDQTLFDGGMMRIQKTRMMYALTHVHTIPTVHALSDASEFIAESSGVVLSLAQLAAILALYPIERSKLAVEGWGASDVRIDTLDVIANFFLSTRWPNGTDNVDTDTFVDRMKKAAVFMGYTVNLI